MRISIIGKIRNIDSDLYNFLKAKINIKPNGIIFLPFGKKKGWYIIPKELKNIKYALIINIKIFSEEIIRVFDRDGNKISLIGKDKEGIFYARKGSLITEFNDCLTKHEIVCDGNNCYLQSRKITEKKQ